MADMTVGFNDRVATGKGMDDTIVLHIGPVANHDPAEVAPQACSGSDIASMTQDDISDQNRLRMDICILGHNGHEPFEFVTIRHYLSFWWVGYHWLPEPDVRRLSTVMPGPERLNGAGLRNARSGKSVMCWQMTQAPYITV